MKCFRKATVYVEGKGLKKRSVVFDSKIKKIVKGNGVSKYAEEIGLPNALPRLSRRPMDSSLYIP